MFNLYIKKIKESNNNKIIRCAKSCAHGTVLSLIKAGAKLCIFEEGQKNRKYNKVYVLV